MSQCACEALWDSMQNSKEVTQANLPRSFGPLIIVNIDNSHFYYLWKKETITLNILIKINTRTYINVGNI